MHPDEWLDAELDALRETYKIGCLTYEELKRKERKAVQTWLRMHPMDAAQFQNGLRIMNSLDEVSQVLGPLDARTFLKDPMQAAIRMDAETWAKVFALIQKRQPTPQKGTPE